MATKNLIQVWCEYDINGEFGGNNNEDVFFVEEGSDVESLVKDRISLATGLEEDELEDLYGWAYLTPLTLE